MTDIFALALGCGTKNRDDLWLEVYYPDPAIKPDPRLVEVVREEVGYQGGNAALELTHRQIQHIAREWRDAGFEHEASYAVAFQECQQPLVLTILETDAEPASTPEAYLKLHLLSHRLVKPHQVVLSGIFPLLPNVAWTAEGAVDLNELPERQLMARLDGRVLAVNSVDKFPKMTDYVVPKGVRIADTARVRLGAYVGEGTTVMHEGFINFNAGTEGPGMIEGRISAGVFVGKGSDLGGSSSTMGTLSGGGNMVIALGENCLLGANAGTGIPLGDRCTIEAGLYITAGTKVELLDDQGENVDTVRARDLAGKSDLLFRRDSLTGAVQCRTNKTAIALNEELHKHN
ncbi:2,3,4,5-tetrahydropyridine-2,6-dicarboxylate N-succinyltransferase [Alcanivorax sp. N3-2A]|nr:2,3,4,5-tetrahydropyridine-2,6-dicarboxylate N-succinyltransferase [Alcanivorax sp. N3-2A]|tara:strand:- start:1777 stop:2811 length:1035 start_codon:yes stop_codon:yes gene_type:complete